LEGEIKLITEKVKRPEGGQNNLFGGGRREGGRRSFSLLREEYNTFRGEGGKGGSSSIPSREGRKSTFFIEGRGSLPIEGKGKLSLSSLLRKGGRRDISPPRSSRTSP